MKVHSRKNIHDNFPDESVKAKALTVDIQDLHIVRPCNAYLAPSHRLYTCLTGVCSPTYLWDGGLWKVSSLYSQLYLPHKKSCHCRETEKIAQHTDLKRHWTCVLECKNTFKWKGLVALGQWRAGKEALEKYKYWASLYDFVVCYLNISTTGLWPQPRSLTHLLRFDSFKRNVIPSPAVHKKSLY